MSFRQPLARIKGLGASGEGSHHWWLQRVTALGLIPLTFWFMFSIVGFIGEGHQAVLEWISDPIVAVGFVLYLTFMFYHAQLGIQVILEDYLHAEGVRLVVLLISKATFLVFGIAAVFAVLRISL